MLTPFVIDIILFCPPMQRAAFFWAKTKDILDFLIIFVARLQAYFCS